MKTFIKASIISALMAFCLLLAGCNTNFGVGLNVGVPIGDYGYMSLGTGRRWR